MLHPAASRLSGCKDLDPDPDPVLEMRKLGREDRLGGKKQGGGGGGGRKPRMFGREKGSVGDFTDWTCAA